MDNSGFRSIIYLVVLIVLLSILLCVLVWDALEDLAEEWLPRYMVWETTYYASTGDLVLDRDPIFGGADCEIDFNWDDGTPHPAIPTDGFAVKWVSRLGSMGEYRICVEADDGVAVFLGETWLSSDRVALINKWHMPESGFNSECVEFTTEADRQPITVVFYDAIGRASISVVVSEHYGWERVRAGICDVTYCQQ